MTDFIRLHEYNDHEGESWNWWLQVDGNENELDKLAGLVVSIEYVDVWEPPYSLSGPAEPEAVVDKLVEYAESGYYSAHNKVTGKFTCPHDLGPDGELLYKGGIKDFFDDPA